MNHVNVWSILKIVKKPAYNQQVRTTDLDPGIVDSINIELWEAGEDVLADTPDYVWNSWPLSPEEADILVNDVINKLGEETVNDPGPQGQAYYYRSDDPREADSETGTATTAPTGGWTNPSVMADLTRKQFALKPYDGPV